MRRNTTDQPTTGNSRAPWDSPTGQVTSAKRPGRAHEESLKNQPSTIRRRSAPRRSSRGKGDETQGIPPWLLITVAVVAVLAVAAWHFTGGNRRARKMVDGLSPDEVTRLLLDGAELPDTLTVQVGGLLDKRVSMVEYEVMAHEDPSKAPRKVDPGHIENLRVFGLLFPSDSELLEREYLLRDHANALLGALRGAGGLGDFTTAWNRAVDAQHALFSVYAGACGDEAILVELDKASHQEFFGEMRTLAAREMTARATGDTRAWETESLKLFAKVLEPEYFSAGTFDVRVIEHHAQLAESVKDDDMTPGLEVPVTVALVN